MQLRGWTRGTQCALFCVIFHSERLRECVLRAGEGEEDREGGRWGRKEN